MWFLLFIEQKFSKLNWFAIRSMRKLHKGVFNPKQIKIGTALLNSKLPQLGELADTNIKYIPDFPDKNFHTH